MCMPSRLRPVSARIWPSPAAAALVAGFLWLASDNKIPVDDYGLPWVAAFLTLYAGLTMVSNVPFYSFKDIDFRSRRPDETERDT